MTLVVSWIGVDSRKISSLNIVSDSRITWGDKLKFEYGKKVFGCKNHAIVVAYCGDVLFPTIVINQIIDLADQGLLFDYGASNNEKFQAFYNKFMQQLGAYPAHIDGITQDTMQVIFASRNGETDFLCRKIIWEKKNNSWNIETPIFNLHSDKVFVIGSGKIEFVKKFDDFLKSNEAKTSRAVFQCFCDTLENIKDKHCGGAPQVISLYNKFNSIPFGIIYNNKRYSQGVELSALKNYNVVEWRNEFFEICDGQTMKIKPDAQKQPRF